ncbi:Acyl-protein thioesterase 1 [Madurella mycetomatis]|uniref:Acyl-protein thioesterase 1 n=1 Tax=Madurella mycetomatis TaxID=100816 RepID=A0A175VW22_9PEZI|nr:Acyl-protein thioesterase 1 [Madurella mycetomatis]
MPTTDFPTVILSPSTTHTHTHTVIFLHGRGDNTKSFTRALSNWRDSRGRNLLDTFPSFKWVFPQAPLRPVAATAKADRDPEIWPQWFDVWNVSDFADREEVQAEGLKEVVPKIRDMIAREASKLGGRWDRVILAGISMGAATGVHTLFNLDVPAEGGGRLAAFMGFCCRCPFAGRGLQGMREALGLEGTPQPGENGVLRGTPMLMEHCADDPLVKIEGGRRLRDILRGFGAAVEWREYPVGGHWFKEPDGIDDVVEFLKTVVLENRGRSAAEGEEAAGTKVPP